MQTTPENRKTTLFLLALYGFNLAGMLVWPDQWNVSSGQGFILTSLLQVLFYAIFLTALPIAALAHTALRKPHMLLAGLFFGISVLSLAPALFIAAISLPSFSKTTLLSALNFSALCLIAGLALAKATTQNPLKFRTLLGIIILLPAWSILSVPMLHLQAALKANGAPYCIAFPGAANERVYTPDYSFWAKRGIALTAKETTGGSQSFQFAFHALLYVEGAPQYWNWSKTTLRFAPLKHPELWSDIQIVCPELSPRS